MSLMHNIFDGKPEVLFVTYEEIIRSPYPFLLHQILTRYRNVYESFLDLSRIEKMDLKNLTRFCVQRQEKNIFQELAKIEFDAESALLDLKKKFVDIYEHSELLVMGKSISVVMNQKFAEKVYIHTEEYDVRVHIDIQTTFGNMGKVSYVTGELGDVLDALPVQPTTYILNDIIDVGTIMFKEKANYSNILVPTTGFNYTLDEEGKTILRLNVEGFAKDHIFKFATFTPVEMTEEHFTIL